MKDLLPFDAFTPLETISRRYVIIGNRIRVSHGKEKYLKKN